MKSLVAILFLINCLAFFMLSHLQKQSELESERAQEEKTLPLSSPEPVILLSEMSAAQLQEINSKPEEPESDAAEETVEDAAPIDAGPQQ